MVGRSLTAYPAANGDPVKHWGDKGGEERNWPPYLTKPMAQDKCSLYKALPNARIAYGAYPHLYTQKIYQCLVNFQLEINILKAI